MKGGWPFHREIGDPEEPITVTYDEDGWGTPKTRELTDSEVARLGNIGANVRRLFGDPEEVTLEAASKAFDEAEKVITGGTHAKTAGTGAWFFECRSRKMVIR